MEVTSYIANAILPTDSSYYISLDISAISNIEMSDMVRFYWRGPLSEIIKIEELPALYLDQYAEEQKKFPNLSLLGMIFSLFPLRYAAPYPETHPALVSGAVPINIGIITRKTTLEKADHTHQFLLLLGETSIFHELEIPFKKDSNQRTLYPDEIPLFAFKHDHDYEPKIISAY